MTQTHEAQEGIFHVTTVTKGRVPWCTEKGVAEIIIDNLIMTRNIYKAHLYGFCVLPDHVHIIVNPGEKGLSKFIQSFKSNTTKHIRRHFSPEVGRRVPPPGNANIFRWQNGFYDERIRDDKQYFVAKSYVEFNAFRHRLIVDPLVWPWSSMHFSHVLDARDVW